MLRKAKGGWCAWPWLGLGGAGAGVLAPGGELGIVAVAPVGGLGAAAVAPVGGLGAVCTVTGTAIRSCQASGVLSIS